jgi:YgiT-type zinc finger domain-containing protein
LCLSEIDRKNEQLAVIRCGEYKFMKNFMDCNCTNQRRTKVTKEIPLARTRVLLENATAWVCQDCGEIYFDGKTIDRIYRDLKEKKEKSC